MALPKRKPSKPTVPALKIADVPHSSKVEWILVSELRIDPEAQRGLKPARIKAMAGRFDPDRLGYIVVNRRDDGCYYVVDGQHRVATMRMIGWGDQKVPCEVFHGLTQKQEADLFLHRNNRIAVGTLDKFRVRLTAGDPVAVAIDKIVKQVGLSISNNVGPNKISAVDALERIYLGARIADKTKGATALAKMLMAICSAWGTESRNFERPVILGIGLLFIRYSKINLDRLVERLTAVTGGAVGLVSKARALNEAEGGALGPCVARAIVTLYNRGLRSGKLESWWK